MADEKTKYYGSFYDQILNTLDREQRRDLASYGANQGVPGLTYTSEIHELYTRYSNELWDIIGKLAQALGHRSALDCLANLNGAENTDSQSMLEQLIVWAAAEAMAELTQDEYGDMDEDDDEEEGED